MADNKGFTIYRPNETIVCYGNYYDNSTSNVYIGCTFNIHKDYRHSKITNRGKAKLAHREVVRTHVYHEMDHCSDNSRDGFVDAETEARMKFFKANSP